MFFVALCENKFFTYRNNYDSNRDKKTAAETVFQRSVSEQDEAAAFLLSAERFSGKREGHV